MNEIEELLKQHSQSPDLSFKNFDGSAKNSLPPTPITALFKNINNLLDSTDKDLSKISLTDTNFWVRNLSANDLLKKKEPKIKQLKRADTDLSVLALSDRKIDCIPETKRKKDKNILDSPSLNDTFQSNPDNENDEGIFRLSVRQPSFSNLTAGHLIVKGIDGNEPQLDKVVEEEVNPVIVLTEKTETEELPITLQVREASKSHFDVAESITLNIPNNSNNQAKNNEPELLESIAKRNAERLRKMGYNPDESIQKKNTQFSATTNSIDSFGKNRESGSNRNNTQTSFLSNKGTKSNNDNKKIKRVTSAGSDFKAPIDDIFANISNNKSRNEDEEDSFDSSKNYYQEYTSESSRQAGSLSFDNSNDDVRFNMQVDQKINKPINNVSKKSQLNKSKMLQKPTKKNNSNWKSNSRLASSSINSDLIEHNFGSEDDQIKPPPIDLKTVKTQNFMNNSDDGSQIPQRLEDLLYNEFHAIIPEESVAYLALRGSDVIGYKESRINEAMLSLRYLLKRCIGLGYITESAYVQGIIDKTIKRQNEFKKFNRVNPSKIVQENLTTAKVNKEVKEKTWNARLVAANSEYQIAVNDLKRRYEEEKSLLVKKWNSKSAALKYRKPSSSLNQMKFVAKKMLDTHRFEEAAALSKSIEENEKNESIEAAKRMKNDYKSALEMLEKKYKNEEVALKLQFDSRKLTLVKKEKVEMLPLDRQVINLENKKEQIGDLKKRNPDNSKVTVYANKKRKSSLAKSSRLAPNLTINTSLKLNLKSALPPSSFNSAKRRTQSRLSRPISYRQERSSDLSQVFD